MSDRQRLKEMWRPFAQAALPEDELRRRRATRIAINDDGGVNEQSVYQSLPWQARDFSIVGALTVGANTAQQLRIRQPSQLAYMDATVKTVPTGGSLVMELAIAGVGTVQTISVLAGATSGVSASNEYIPIPAGSLLQLNVTAASGAFDATVTAWLVPDSGGA